MRILVCAKNDLAGLLACNRLSPGLAEDQVSFWLSDVTRRDELDDPDLAALRLFERNLPNRWILPLLEARGPVDGPTYLTFRQLARRHGGELRHVSSLSGPDVVRDIERHAPDLLISIRFSHIFPARLLQIPRLGSLNIHPGELPQYAGLFAPFWQILDDRATIGCTVHWIDQGIDTGPVLWCGWLPVDPARSLLWHVCRTYPVGVDEVLALVRQMGRGRRPAGLIQDRRARHYFRLPTRDDFARFKAKGFRVVDDDDYDELLAPFGVRPGGLGPDESVSDAASGGLRRPA